MTAKQNTRIRDEDEFGPLPTYLELAMATAAANAHDPAQAPKSRWSLARLTKVEKAVASVIAMLIVYGLLLIGHGLYLKTASEFSHIPLKWPSISGLSHENTRPLSRAS